MALRIDTKDEEAASTAITDMQVLSFSPSHNDNHLGQLAQTSWYLGLADTLASTLSPKPSTLNLQPSAWQTRSRRPTSRTRAQPPPTTHPPPPTPQPPGDVEGARGSAGAAEIYGGGEGGERDATACWRARCCCCCSCFSSSSCCCCSSSSCQTSQPYTVNHNPSSRSPEEGCCYSSVSWQTSQPYTANNNPQALREDAAAAALTPDGASEEHAQRRESMP